MRLSVDPSTNLSVYPFTVHISFTASVWEGIRRWHITSGIVNTTYGWFIRRLNVEKQFFHAETYINVSLVCVCVCVTIKGYIRQRYTTLGYPHKTNYLCKYFSILTLLSKFTVMIWTLAGHWTLLNLFPDRN